MTLILTFKAMLMRAMKMITVFVALSIAGCASLNSPDSGVDPLFGLGDREVFQISSEALDRDFHVLVRLPRGYAESDRSYPMVLLLDGGILFPMLAPYQLMMEVQGSAEEIIVVGVSYGGLGFANGNLRSTDFTAPSAERDYYGGATAYQKFLANEVLPRLKSEYRIDEGRTLLLGQSLGGQFAIHAAMTRPELFSTYVAVNPALHSNLEYFLDPDLVTVGDAHLLVALGSEDDPRFRVPALEWLDFWTARQDRPFSLEVLALEGEHHATSAPAAYFDVVSRLLPAPSE